MDTRITVVSDTHLRHEEIELPAGDLLIHCGDMFELFGDTASDVSDIDAWFARQDFAQILCTGGNHDRQLERVRKVRSQPFEHAHYLEDETFEFRGLKIHGSPWVPDLPRHAFYKGPAALAVAWAQVPSGIDILVTHTPPKGMLDTSSRGGSFGCSLLAQELARIAPRVHCFGHVHASAGRRTIGSTTFINASSIESGTNKIHRPMTFTLSSRDG